MHARRDSATTNLDSAGVRSSRDLVQKLCILLKLDRAAADANRVFPRVPIDGPGSGAVGFPLVGAAGRAGQRIHT